MGPLGPGFMALWTLCALTGSQRLQWKRKNGFVLWARSTVPGSASPPGDTLQNVNLIIGERINRKNDAALYNRLGHSGIYVQCVFFMSFYT